MRSSFTAVIAAAVLTVHANAAYNFVECANPLLVTNLLTGLINAVTTLLSPANSYTGCPTYCSSQGTAYSVYQPGIAGLLGTCYCTNTEPTATYTTAGSNSGGSCFAGTYQINYLTSVADPMTFSTCTTGTTVPVGSPAPFTTSSAAQCFATCQPNYKYLILTPASGASFTCQCANFITQGTATTCARNVQNLYSRANIEPSGVARKRSLAAAAEKKRRENDTPCPRGYDACIVPGSEAAYECLDTSAELEACGGCVYGYWDKKIRGTTGVDCSVAPGVALGGSTCQRGQCKVTRCLFGYELKDGQCVRKFKANNERHLL